MSFYIEVVLELLLALGAALFFANITALIQNRKKKNKAPFLRTFIYIVIGFVAAVWSLITLIVKFWS